MSNEILTKLLQMVPCNTNLELPPKIFFDMEGEFVDFVASERLTARYPNKERYMNPSGYMQGGVIVAAVDNTISPLSYVIAPPNITKEICTTFKRPIKASDRFIEVVATIVEKTTANIKLQANVMNEKGKLAAIGIAHCSIIREPRH